MSNKNVTPINSSEAARELVNCLEEMQKVQQKVTTKLLGLTYHCSKSNVITGKGIHQVGHYGKGQI